MNSYHPIAAAAYNSATAVSRLALIAIFAYAALQKANAALALAVLSIGAAYVCQYMEAMRHPEINADEVVRDMSTQYVPFALVASVLLWLVSFVCAFMGW